MNKSLLALAAFAAFNSAAQAHTEGSRAVSGMSVANSSSIPAMEVGAMAANKASPVTILEELETTAVLIACGCYPNLCGA